MSEKEKAPMSAFEKIVQFLRGKRRKSCACAKKYYRGNGIEDMTKEEIKKYYYALGMADMSEDLLKLLENK